MQVANGDSAQQVVLNRQELFDVCIGLDRRIQNLAETIRLYPEQEALNAARTRELERIERTWYRLWNLLFPDVDSEEEAEDDGEDEEY